MGRQVFKLQGDVGSSTKSVVYNRLGGAHGASAQSSSATLTKKTLFSGATRQVANLSAAANRATSTKPTSTQRAATNLGGKIIPTITATTSTQKTGPGKPTTLRAGAALTRVAPNLRSLNYSAFDLRAGSARKTATSRIATATTRLATMPAPKTSTATSLKKVGGGPVGAAARGGRAVPSLFAKAGENVETLPEELLRDAEDSDEVLHQLDLIGKELAEMGALDEALIDDTGVPLMMDTDDSCLLPPDGPYDSGSSLLGDPEIVADDPEMEDPEIFEDPEMDLINLDASVTLSGENDTHEDEPHQAVVSRKQKCDNPFEQEEPSREGSESALSLRSTAEEDELAVVEDTPVTKRKRLQTLLSPTQNKGGNRLAQLFPKRSTTTRATEMSGQPKLRTLNGGENRFSKLNGGENRLSKNAGLVRKPELFSKSVVNTKILPNLKKPTPPTQSLVQKASISETQNQIFAARLKRANLLKLQRKGPAAQTQTKVGATSVPIAHLSFRAKMLAAKAKRGLVGDNVGAGVQEKKASVAVVQKHVVQKALFPTKKLGSIRQQVQRSGSLRQPTGTLKIPLSKLKDLGTKKPVASGASALRAATLRATTMRAGTATLGSGTATSLRGKTALAARHRILFNKAAPAATVKKPFNK